jgi:hypothetical protein
MSLLPSRILPASEPIGHLADDGKTVLIEKNYWLFLYNLSGQVLGTGAATTPGTPGAPGAPGAPGSPLLSPALLLAATDSDIADADAMALRQSIQNLGAQLPDLPPTAADFPDIARALLLAQDTPLPDPAPQAQPAAAITVTASPFTYTAGFNGSVAVTGGTVSLIQLIRQGVTVATGLTAGLIPVSRRDQVVVTWTGSPTMTFLPT